MLSEREATILRQMIEGSPDPNVQYFFSFPGEDAAVLDRLVHLGLIQRKGFSPVQYLLADAGRHHFRNTAERKAVSRKARRAATRREWLFMLAGAILGAVAIKLVDWLFLRFIAP